MVNSTETKDTTMKAIRKTWQLVAKCQNQGWFARTHEALLPSEPNPLYRIPAGLDLRVSAPGIHNAHATLTFTQRGDVIVSSKGKTFPLGSLAGKTVVRGWIITGLRLRGALRFPDQDLILMVPDREDIPYLIRVLVSKAEAGTESDTLAQALAA